MAPPPSLAEVKRNLSFVWGKESDPSETYTFDLAGSTSWSCVRENQEGSRKFRVTYDANHGRLWWGESYFTDPSDVAQRPDRLQWYKTSDRAKAKPAFLWKRLREVSTKAATVSQSSLKQATKASPASSGKPTQNWKPKGVEEDRRAQIIKRPPAEVLPRENSSRSTYSRSTNIPKPEIILDLDQMLVVYKPPYWKVELPAKDQIFAENTDSTVSKDNLYLLRWIKEKVTCIDTSLFEEEFNPALSGTGFGPLSHRIDQETSGPLLVAKNASAQKHLRSQFHKTEVSKRYICLVHGKVAKHKGIVDASIRTLRTDFTTRSEISTSGDWAKTEYEVLSIYNGRAGGTGYTLLACDISSGRTHQIRVHMQHIGHPLVSDDKYQATADHEEDRKWCPRLFLHSYRLQFRSLTQETQVVTCPLPPDLKAALKQLGAADAAAHNTDSMFGETSFQWEVFRPPLSAWRPGSEVQRRVLSLLTASAEPVPLSKLNSDNTLRRLMVDHGISNISRAWLSTQWDVFEAVPKADGGELCVRLRPSHATGEGNAEVDLDRQIEAVRSELEELQRLKQRAVAEEQYVHAADIKRRAEATAAELQSLLALVETDEQNYEKDDVRPISKPGLIDVSGIDFGKHGEQVQSRKHGRAQKAEVFTQDVQDEVLFPSLSSNVTRPAVTKHAAVDRSRPQTEDNRQERERSENNCDLKEALVLYLEGKENNVSHINEINNDRTLRQVMALQKPKAITSINKAWLKQYEDCFTVLRTAENEMYVALSKALEKKKLDAKSKARSADSQKQIAYRQVIQKNLDDAPLVYEYGFAARKDEQFDLKSKEHTGAALTWQDKFLQALQLAPTRSLTAAELLEAVPLFAAALGSKKPRELQELLVTFLQASPHEFQVVKQGSGTDRTYRVLAK